MTQAPIPPVALCRGYARPAGLTYAGLILCGLTAELALRGQLTGGAGLPDRAQALLHLSVVADLAMLTCDAVLAVLLYRMLRPAGETLALMAMVFRLAQMAVLGGNLVPLAGPAEVAQIPALLARHAAGYDLGLVFFAITLLLTAQLLCRSGRAPRLLAAGLMAAGLVYLAGSLTRFLAPALNAAMQPAYLLPLLAELGFCLWLLLGAPTSRRQAQPA